MSDKFSWPAASALAGALVLAAAQYFIWVYAPVEASLGLPQKIFYYHIGLAWWSLVSFLVVFAASAAYLVKMRPGADRLAGAAAEAGVLFSGLALVAGSIWAKASWGVWWTWDPRLTTTLVMWFVYCGYLILRASGVGRDRRALVCAVVGVVAFLDVPLVFYSARMWRSVHPAVFKRSGGGMEPEMLTAMLVCLLGFGLVWLAMVAIRTGILASSDRLGALAARAREREVLNRGQYGPDA